jgi:hypothetical protein
LLAARKKLRENVGILSIVVPECEFGQIQREIRLADFVVAAHDAASEQRPKRFNRLRMDFAAHKFIGLVRDEIVFEAHPIQMPIAETLIGRD